MVTMVTNHYRVNFRINNIFDTRITTATTTTTNNNNNNNFMKITYVEKKKKAFSCCLIFNSSAVPKAQSFHILHVDDYESDFLQDF